MLPDKKPLKLAFIGGGEDSAVGYVHFSASQLDNCFEVVAGAFSRSSKSNELTAQRWNINSERLYTCWKTLIQQEADNVDAFVLLTPTPDHLAMLTTLLDKNLAIICEKSLVGGPKEIALLKQHYQADKHFLAVTFNYSGYAMVRELKHKIANGELGAIQKIHLEMPQEGFRRPPDIAGQAATPQPWRLCDGELPTICLDLGVHLHHLSSFLLNIEPNETIAEFSNHSQYPELIDDIQMLLKYPNNIKGSMWMSKTAIGHRNGLKIRVYGDQGSALWYQLNPDELELSFNDGRREILDRASQCHHAGKFIYNRMKPGHPTGFVEAFANLYRDIATSLHTFKSNKKIQSPYVFSVEHAADGLNLFKAAKESTLSSQWQKVK
ncbi:Gfo/Idh/MocA family protein [Colwellia echini]|uniref:Gfo/Idh/MocA family oxidoreductase n=1 Tax=Colwellia echini TaxID=1982103 RepID=A0ABY3MWL1_9GAMM|nr:Gfo/Idh/MocA family oxidoreductase [Colwellia echini]TYK65600.1 Gfo/Idh/MocA family oxidoreductase [Colwellia echini]